MLSLPFQVFAFLVYQFQRQTYHYVCSMAFFVQPAIVEVLYLVRVILEVDDSSVRGEKNSSAVLRLLGIAGGLLLLKYQFLQ